jgi:peptide/nickel transport system substrate-binding protein
MTTQANWWDKFGEPEYGGTITVPTNRIENAFDPYNWQTTGGAWRDTLWWPDWTLDRSSGIFGHRTWIPEIHQGIIAESWEWEDSKTLVVHLRQDVYWQDIAPVNGRQFTADDVVWHFDRMLGTGSGFDTPSPFFAGRFDACKNVTARDKSTVVFNFKNPTLFINAASLIPETMFQAFEAKEVYDMGEPLAEGSGINTALNDWKTQVGTGPFTMTDLVANSTMVVSRYPDYWCYDERYPDNQLPYVDSIKTLYIPDTATQMAALRTGKIDWMAGIDWQQAESLEGTNPDLLNETFAQPGCLIQLRVDKEPFTDIKVRKALQLAVNLPEIAEGYYGGTLDGKPVGLVSPYFEGYAIPYDNWPQELQEEYSYNPTAAKQLLTEAGYPDGFKTNILAASGGPGGDMQLLQIIKAYFLDIGVDMEINAMSDFFTIMQMLMDKKHDQMVLMGTSDDMPPAMGMRMFTKAEATNGLCNDDPEWEAKVAAVLTADDEEEAKQLVIDADMYFLRQHWCVLVFPIVNYNFWQPYVKGYSGEKEPSTTHWARCWIDQDLKTSMGR